MTLARNWIPEDRECVGAGRVFLIEELGLNTRPHTPVDSMSTCEEVMPFAASWKPGPAGPPTGGGFCGRGTCWLRHPVLLPINYAFRVADTDGIVLIPHVVDRRLV